jgi:hypothetical protein
MLITKSQIEEVLNYNFNDVPVTSLYLNVDPVRYPKEEYMKNIKTLLRENKEKLKKEDFSRNSYYSVLEDFKSITMSVEAVRGHGFQGLALFSSSKNKFLQAYELDAPVSDRLVVDYVPYTKPLFSVLALKKRYMALLFKKNKLRVFEVFGEKIKEEIDLFSSSRFSSRSNAYIFINEKKYQNRLETEYNKFLREASGEALSVFMKKGADYIVLGGDKNACRDFLKYMHSYLQSRYAGCIEVDFNAGEKEVLRGVKKICEKQTAEQDKEFIGKIKKELSKGGEACRGIEDVLKALSAAAMSVLVIEEGYSVPGYIDKEGTIVHVSTRKPEEATKGLFPVKDVTNEVIDEAIHLGAEVRLVRDKTLMKGLDHIAALLRFKPKL